MVGYDGTNNALTLGDGDALSVGDYELEYSNSDDQWQARYNKPIGGATGLHGEIVQAQYTSDSKRGSNALRKSSTERQYVKFPSSTFSEINGQNFSWAYWVKTSTTSAQVYCVSLGGRNFDRINKDGNGLYSVSLTGASGDAIPSTTAINDGNWHHVGVTWDGTTQRVYVDGTEENSGTPTRSLFGGNTDHAIGGNTANLSGWVGTIDDVRFYTKVLSSSEMSTLASDGDVTDSLLHHYDFEYPETERVAIDATGEAYPKNSVPRSTTDSLVPQGLAESVSAGEALADDGNTYTSVQNAVNAASGWVFVGPGTFNETVAITTAGLTIEGSGYDTLIDGGTSNDAINTGAANITIRNLSVQTTAGGGSGFDGIRAATGSDSLTIENVNVRSSDAGGILLANGNDHTVRNCQLTNIDARGIFVNGVSRTVISGNTVSGTSTADIEVTGDDNIITNNITQGGGNNSIYINANDNIIIGNRVINPFNAAVYLNSGNDNIVANNRLSGGGITDLATGTLLDGNNTNAAN